MSSLVFQGGSPNTEREQASYATTTSGSTGDELVPAVAGTKIRVLGLLFTNTNAGEFALTSNFAGVNIASFYLGANSGCAMPLSDIGWCETAVGHSLCLSISAGDVGVTVVYRRITPLVAS